MQYLQFIFRGHSLKFKSFIIWPSEFFVTAFLVHFKKTRKFYGLLISGGKEIIREFTKGNPRIILDRHMCKPLPD